MDGTSPIASSRRYDLDWVRALATYMLLPIHVAIVFSPLPFYHIRNSTVSLGMLALLAFGGPWFMPLFFVLAGWALCHSLRARGSGGLLKERFQKLFIPLIVGCLLFGPPIKYLELRSGFDANYLSACSSANQTYPFGPCLPATPAATPPPFAESFLEFWPTFFTRFDRFTWSHLWFLGYLCTFSLLYLPLFRWLTKLRHNWVPVGTAWVYLPMISLLWSEITLRPHWPGIQNLYNDWANFAYFSTCLIAGFLLARYPALEQALRREWKRALGIGLLGMALRAPLVVGTAISPILSSLGLVLTGWGVIVALLGFAQDRLSPISKRTLRRTNALLAYLKESAYPVYILHQAAVVGIGYWIIQLPLGIAAKYALLLAASFAATLAAYEFVVRRIPVLRLAFGMKPLPRQVGPEKTGAVTAI